jgi:RimJ/RimL family protein N-acetyltransferase
MGTYVRYVSLRPETDGAVWIREIRHDDHDRLRDSHERLSPESRYRRFLAAKPQLTSADARYLVEIDGCDHFALVATLPEAEGQPIVGVARFVRLPEDREIAEVAIVVNDAYQRRGMGAELVSRLAEAAVARGVRRFRATMLSDNLAIHRVLENLAAGPIERRRLGGLSEMDLPLPGAESPGADCGAPTLLSA